MHSVEGSRRLRLVLLDACRDNPFVQKMAIASGRGRSIGRGLGRIEPPADTLVAYSAKDGQVAQDGTGANSPCTTALLQQIETPGLGNSVPVSQGSRSVLAATGIQQEPYVYGSLGGEPYYLSPMDGAPAVDRNAEVELAFWRSLEQSSDPAEYQEYLRRFPDGTFALLAGIGLGISRGRLAKLRQRPTKPWRHRRLPSARPATAPPPKPPASRMCHPLAPRTPRRAAIAPISWPGLSSASRCRLPTSLYCGSAGHDAGEDLLPDSRIGAHRLAERLQHLRDRHRSRRRRWHKCPYSLSMTPFGPRPLSSSTRRNFRRAGKVSRRRRAGD